MMGVGIKYCINCYGQPRPHFTYWLFRCPVCDLQ